MNNEHIWTDPPYSFCYICGMPNLLETAIRRQDYDALYEKWKSKEIERQYEALFFPCPINKEECEVLMEFAYRIDDETQIEIL